MDERRITLIRRSWDRLEDQGSGLARTFYDRLFEVAPRMRDLFAATGMESQSEKFLAMLGELLHLLEDPERFDATLTASGRRHAGYGVMAHHYRTVGEALLWSLDHTLPGGMDDDTREAWAEAYTRMAFLMQQASA